MTVAERDALADDYALRYGQLATLLADGAITFAEWQRLFSDLLVELVAAGYVAGRGGLERMADADWLIVATIVKDQHAYFDGFRQDIQSRIDDRAFGATIAEILNASQAYIGQRSALYAGASVNAYERGKTAEASEGKGVLVLPVYPADGGSSCRSNCRCEWVITSNDDEHQWECRWDTRSDDRVCPECEERGMLYAHFVVPYDATITPEAELR
jgi:hypothetical protein